MISFKPLEHTLIDRDTTKAELGRACNLSPTTLARMSKGESVTLAMVERICLYLKCPVEKVVEILPDRD